MARYNHFAKPKYKTVLFSSIPIGGKFRNDFFTRRGTRRPNIVLIKTGELTYVEQQSKKEHSYLVPGEYEVYSYDELNTQ